MQKIKKAVIPAAGLGTRVLPASKAMPKEMLPIVDKPAIQYIVEEAVKSGIEDILIITSRGKTTVEDHFDRSPELESRLLASGKTDVYNQLVDISNLANISYIRQKETKGLGHAILCAKTFVGNDPFAVLYGDDVIIGENPVCGQLCEAYEKYGLGVVGIKEAAGAVYGMVKGKAATLFYPVYVMPKFDLVTAFSMVSFAAMLLVPAAMDMYGEIRWRRAGSIEA